METPETEINYIPPADPGMILSEEAQYYLQQSAKWATFLSIMGFIGCGFIAIAALFMGTVMSSMQSSRYASGPNPFSMMGAAGAFIGVIYFIIALIMFFINLNLYQFASKVKRAIAFNESDVLTKALGKLNSFLKTKGIVLICILAFYILIIVFVAVVGVSAMAGR